MNNNQTMKEIFKSAERMDRDKYEERKVEEKNKKIASGLH